MILLCLASVQPKNFKCLNFIGMDISIALQTIITSDSIMRQQEEKKALAAYLNHLLLNDFSALVQALYRVDVSEQKVKAVLKENPQADAGNLLAELLVQRQREKIAVKQTPRPMDKSSDEEAW